MSKKKRAPQGYKAKPVTAPPTPVFDAGIDDSPGEDMPQINTPIELPKWEHSLIDVEPDQVFESDLKNLMRDWRRGRATKTLRQVLADGYVTVFAVVMIVAMLGGAVFRAQSSAAACNTEVCTVGKTLLPWVVMSAAFCLTAMASRIFGPVVASAAEGFWLMDAPIKRGRLLWRRLVAVVIVVGLITAGLGGLLAALTGYGLDDIWRWAVAMGVGAAGLTALAASEQTWGRSWIISIIQWLLGLAAVGVLFVIVAVAADWFGWAMPTVPSTTSVVWMGVAGAAVLLIAGTTALTRLGKIHRARLVSGGSLVTGMQGAAFAMDIALMRDILVERDSMRRGHVRPQKGRWVGTKALVWREIQRLWRYPKRMILVVASVVIPYAVAALGFDAFSPFISSIILLIGFVPLLGSMRVMTRTKGLARTLPLSNPQIRQAMATVPAGIAVVWAIAATPAFWGWGSGGGQPSLFQAFITAALTTAAGLLAAIRWVSAKSANYSAPMMQTGFGALPPTMMFNLVRGIDIVVLVTGPMLLHWAWWISGIIVVIAAFALSGAYSMEEMQAQQEELQKEREKAKGSGGSSSSSSGGLFGGGRPSTPPPKQKIAPPRGYQTPRRI